MATGGRPFSQANVGCDEYFDFSCSPCERRHGATTEAKHYCTQCDEYFCTSCLDSHGSFQSSKDHKVLARDKEKKWRQQNKSIKKRTPVSQEQCIKHPEQDISMFCKDHNSLLCHACVSFDHRTCEGVHYIPDIATGITQSLDYKVFNNDFERLISNAEVVMQCREQTKTTFDMSRHEYLGTIKDLRKKVNATFDDLERKVETETGQMLKESSSQADADIHTCENIKTNIQQLQQHTKTASTDNEVQTFIDMKKYEKQLSEYDTKIQDLAEMTPKESFQYFVSPQLDTFFTNVQSLGQFTVRRSTQPIIKQHDPKQEHCKSNTRKIKLHVAHKSKKYDIKIKSDKDKCDIVGSCQLPDGTVLLADYDTHNLKRLTPSYQVNDYCHLPAAPRAVCCVSQQEAAVATIKNTIVFVSIHSSMAVTRIMKTDHECFNMLLNNNKLYITSGKAIYIYNMEGTCLSIITKDNKDNDLFEMARGLCTSLDGNKVYVADVACGLVVLDGQGKHVSTHANDDDLRGAMSVCVDTQGSVLVGCAWSRKILQFSEDGVHKLKEVVKLSEKNMRSVCFDKNKNALITTFEETNYIKVSYLN